jgi:hypothetical protein
MFFSNQSLKCPISNLALKVTSSEGLSEIVTLMVGDVGGEVFVLLSSKTVLTKITASNDEWLRAGGFDPQWVNAHGTFSAAREIDCGASFLEAFRLLHEAHKHGEIDNERFAEHVEMISYYQTHLDPEAILTYLHLEDMSDIANQFIIYRHSDNEIKLWKAVWPKAIRLLRATIGQ